ncbi:MAG: type I phosphomannose isomerase catalytic subunit [Lachnospiraceae bacterium]|nr:type I phosphomannose isomerase catalytic subunit [Lachnospiraceae bacterium]
MINKSMTLKGMNKPFLLEPVGKDYLWGGRRLQEDYGKCLDISPLAETWECSTHPDGISIIKSGEHSGTPLDALLKIHPEYLGTHGKNQYELPILIKYIDAKEKLSIQVHPSDEYAMEYENGSLGKTEMWYVVDAGEDAELIYGFYQDTDKETVKKSLDKGTIEKYLQKIKVKKDDIFYIEAGTIHAIGADILLVEVQENSNLTYRLYDYNRVDKNGKKRELQIEKALENINYKGSDTPRQPMRVLHYEKGCASELLCRCKYFQVYRMLLNNLTMEKSVEIQTDFTSFQVLLCLDGSISLTDWEGQRLDFFKGDCVFVPAQSVPMQLRGKAQLLRISC